MKIRFNNGTEKQLVNTPVEQRLYKSGEPFGWMLTLSVSDISSEEIDTILSDSKNINKLTFISDENEERFVEVVGYEKATTLSIKHTELSDIADFQLTKGV